MGAESEVIIALLYSLLMAHKLLSMMIYHFKSHFHLFVFASGGKKCIFETENALVFPSFCLR